MLTFFNVPKHPVTYEQTQVHNGNRAGRIHFLFILSWLGSPRNIHAYSFKKNLYDEI